ncbi:MAG TPA: hypothetical protein VFM94_05845 [Solirubrobacterales bacterium]|nr:hypothetical protein [Solirubrobacterales bacterium]
MIGTYAAVLAVCGSSLALGQAALALCGVRRWSWLAPAVGLALLCAICWATVRMPGEGLVSAVVVLLLVVVAAASLAGRVQGGGEALRAGAPVAIGALLAASLPFAAEGHFGILGTGFNPDMSQHLLATDRLAGGESSQLLVQGYPLGPHSVVVALSKGLGIGIVQGFSGLTIAAAVLAPLTALTAFADHPPWRRTAAALLVGLPYLVASYYAQGAFKEVVQALFVLAFVLALRESTRTWQDLPLRFVPAAIVAMGSVYTYSFPGLIWLGAIAVIWTAAEWARSKSTSPAGLRAMSLAAVVFLVGVLPELGRMLDFKQFETFDPSGPGLGNLFGQISPFTALGIWPSGDFRLAPGDGAVPALVYYLGAAFASVLLVLGVRQGRRNGERAILAGLVSAAALYVAARLGGTPYTAAKALEIAAPLATLTILLPLTWREGVSPAGGAAGGNPHGGGRGASEHMGEPAATGPAGRDTPSLPAVATLVLYLCLAAACSMLAFANAPVGPTSYSPALTGLRPLLASGSTLVLAPESLLSDEHGERYIAWELRGGRVCVKPESVAGGRLPAGIEYVITSGAPARPFDQLTLRERAGPYSVWERRGNVHGPSPCPLIAVRQERAGR